MDAVEYRALLRAHILGLIPPSLQKDPAFRSLVESVLSVTGPEALYYADRLTNFLQTHVNPSELLKLRLLLSSPHATFLSRSGDLLELLSNSELPARQRSGIRSLLDLLRVSEERLIVDYTPGRACLNAWIRWAEMISLDPKLPTDLRSREQDLGRGPDCLEAAEPDPNLPEFVSDVTTPVLIAMNRNLSCFGVRAICTILKYLCHEVAPNIPQDLMDQLRLRGGELDAMISELSNVDILNVGIGLFKRRLIENKDRLMAFGVTHVNVNKVIVKVLESPLYLVVPNLDLANEIRRLDRQDAISGTWNSLE